MSFATGGVLSSIGQGGNDLGKAYLAIQEIRRQLERERQAREQEQQRIALESARVEQSRQRSDWERDPQRIREQEDLYKYQTDQDIRKIEAQNAAKLTLITRTPVPWDSQELQGAVTDDDPPKPLTPEKDHFYYVYRTHDGKTKVAVEAGPTVGQRTYDYREQAKREQLINDYINYQAQQGKPTTREQANAELGSLNTELLINKVKGSELGLMAKRLTMANTRQMMELRAKVFDLTVQAKTATAIKDRQSAARRLQLDIENRVRIANVSHPEWTENDRETLRKAIAGELMVDLTELRTITKEFVPKVVAPDPLSPGTGNSKESQPKNRLGLTPPK